MTTGTSTAPAPFGVQIEGLTVRYGSTTALDAVTTAVRPGTITGLLGPNGSGKSTLLAVLTGFRRAREGRVLVDGRTPFEDAHCAAHTCFVREAGDVIADEKISRTLALHAALRPTWDQDLALAFLDRCEVDVSRKPSKLSRGQRSAVGAAIGLASRAPLTVFDEVQLGMDAETRYAFYETLLADYAEHPRTVLLSSHLIGELEGVLEDVVLLRRGRLVAACGAEALRARVTTLVGPSEQVEQLGQGRTVLAIAPLGSARQVILDQGERPLTREELAAAPGVQVSAVSLQDAVVHLTGTGVEPTAAQEATR